MNKFDSYVCPSRFDPEERTFLPLFIQANTLRNISNDIETHLKLTGRILYKMLREDTEDKKYGTLQFPFIAYS